MHLSLLHQFLQTKLFHSLHLTDEAISHLHLSVIQESMAVHKTDCVTDLFFYSRGKESSLFCFCKQLYMFLYLSTCKHNALMKYLIVSSNHPFILYFEILVLLVPMAVIKQKEESALQVVVSCSFQCEESFKSLSWRSELTCIYTKSCPFCITLSSRLTKSAASSHILSQKFLKGTWRYL